MRLRTLWPRLELARYQSRQHPSSFWRFSLELNTRIRPLRLPHPREPLVSMFSSSGHACSHPRVPRAHQAGLSRRSLAGAGLSESVRYHGPGLALLINGDVQQPQHFCTNGMV
ncbi:hypothetical protein TNCV_1403081 [Trichonephila clavipes]|nr:hypothetical protein TNCV_1403081 [Trichonephila clavipes]